ncbi:MAG TPA: hypothetical protein VNT53_00635 [Pseudolysinimonas sp.]|nr:hypothetical protein [Pseudolysinimonas sp.]
MFKNVIRASIVVAACIGLLVPAVAASAESSVAPDPAQIYADTPDTTNVTLLLAHTVTLQDAIKLSGAVGEPVVAYAYDNVQTMGEYSPATGLDPAKFLAQFQEDYGTQPAVNGFVVLRDAEQQKKSKALDVQQTQLGSTYPTYVAPSVKFGPKIAARIEAGKQAAAKKQEAELGGAQTLAVSDWRPDDANIVTGDSSPFIWSQYDWLDYGLYSLPNNIGLEFEVNEHNDSIFTPNNNRPNCYLSPGTADPYYKSRFWARNYGWTWQATNIYGTPVASIQAYADYNDLSDKCRTNSIAIGLRKPKNLDNYQGLSGVEIQISAPAGLVTSSKISGNVQAVTESFCLSWPGNGMSSTDCMGVNAIQNEWGGYPAGNYNRGTLAESRGWVTPWKCWTSGNRGLDAPVAYSCFG